MTPIARRLATAATLAAALVTASAGTAEAGLRIKAPGLKPEFRAGVHDYTVECGRRVPLSVRTPGRTGSRVGARPWSRGASKRTLRMAEGQAIRILSGAQGDVTDRYWVRCIPESFPEYEFERFRKPRAPLYVFTTQETPDSPSHIVIVDRWGVPMWWDEPRARAVDAKVLDDGTIVSSRYFGGGFGTDPNMAYEFRRPNGRVIRTLKTAGSVTDFHDLQPTGDGNYLVLSYRPRAGVDTSAFNGDSNATVLDGVVQELTPGGKLVSEWSTEGHIGLDETPQRWWDSADEEPYDHVHINAVELLRGGDFMISLRHTDAVYRVDGDTGRVEWKLGGTPTPKSLVVKGDPLADLPLAGQHDVRSLGRGEVSVFDNGTGVGRRPRSVRYRIRDGTATLIDAVAADRSLVSVCCGSARVLGRWFLTAWGGNTLIDEANAAGRRTFRLDLAAGFSYRAVPVLGEVTRSQLRSGMNRQVPPKR